MEFLHGLKYILAVIGISKSKSVKVVGVRISTAFMQWFIGVSILINITLQFCLCIKFYQTFGIQSILVPSHFLFYYISLGFIFGSLLRKADLIFELFEFIEQIIRKSRQNSDICKGFAFLDSNLLIHRNNSFRIRNMQWIKLNLFGAPFIQRESYGFCFVVCYFGGCFNSRARGAVPNHLYFLGISVTEILVFNTRHR